MEPVYVKPLQTIGEVFENLPEGTLAQLINNQLIMSPAPSDSHQRVLDKIYRRLGDYIETHNLGATRVAPYDVYLNRKNIYQPDIIFIAQQNLPLIRENGFHGAPDLVIEILSPATWHYDKGEKKDEYERSGVKEYWMVDPTTKTAEGFCVAQKEFQPLHSAAGTITFGLFNLEIVF